MYADNKYTHTLLSKKLQPLKIPCYIQLFLVEKYSLHDFGINLFDLRSCQWLFGLDLLIISSQLSGSLFESITSSLWSSPNILLRKKFGSKQSLFLGIPPITASLTLSNRNYKAWWDPRASTISLNVSLFWPNSSAACSLTYRLNRIHPHNICHSLL